ncbi:putative F-box domain-containing protein [Tanacetum coccineum]
MSVSKSWKSLIQSSRYIVGYQQTQRLLVSYCDDTHDIKYVSVVDDDTYPMFSLSAPNFLYKPTVVGGSQGLFCIYNYASFNSATKAAIIWNPTIRKSVDIVVPNVLNNHRYITTVGFGVCPQTCDPKLVKIISDRQIQSKSSIPWQVEVFTLSSGVWTSLSTNLPRKSIWFSYNQVDIDGFTYWRVADRFYQDDGRIRWNNMIMSFDTKSTEFAEIYLPGSLSNYDEIVLKISMLRGSLVMLECNRMAYWSQRKDLRSKLSHEIPEMK